MTETVPEEGQLEVGIQSLNVGILEFSVTIKRKCGCLLREIPYFLLVLCCIYYEYYKYFAHFS